MENKDGCMNCKFCSKNLDGNSKNKNYTNIIWQHDKNSKYVSIISEFRKLFTSHSFSVINLREVRFYNIRGYVWRWISSKFIILNLLYLASYWSLSKTYSYHSKNKTTLFQRSFLQFYFILIIFIVIIYGGSYFWDFTSHSAYSQVPLFEESLIYITI
jgi:hypothetical protein